MGLTTTDDQAYQSGTCPSCEQEVPPERMALHLSGLGFPRAIVAWLHLFPSVEVSLAAALDATYAANDDQQEALSGGSVTPLS